MTTPGGTVWSLLQIQLITEAYEKILAKPCSKIRIINRQSRRSAVPKLLELTSRVMLA